MYKAQYARFISEGVFPSRRTVLFFSYSNETDTQMAVQLGSLYDKNKNVHKK